MDLQMKKYKKGLTNGGLFVSIRGACDESLSRQSLGGCDSCGCMLPHVSTSAVHLRHKREDKEKTKRRQRENQTNCRNCIILA